MICKDCGAKMSCNDTRAQRADDWRAPLRRWECAQCGLKAVTTETVLTVRRVRLGRLRPD